MTDLKQIHEDVLAFLLRWRQERDPNLTFTLRRRPEERLREGYWFEGNEYGLVVSFWTGTDTEQNRPNIFVEVEGTGHVNLILSSRNDAQKAEFFEEVAGVLGGFAQYAFWHTWKKDYKDTDFLKAIEDFLINDKNRIDLYIEKTNERNPGKFFPITDLSPLDREAFEASLAEILRYRSTPAERIRKRTKHDLLITSVAVENIGLFGSCSLEFGRRITFLIGENGCGKTTLMRATALGLVGSGSITSANVRDMLGIAEVDWNRSVKHPLYDGTTRQGNMRKIYKGVGKITVSYIFNSIRYENGRSNQIFCIPPTAGKGIELNDIIDKEGLGIPMGEALDGGLPVLLLGYPQHRTTGEISYDKFLLNPAIDDVKPLIEKKLDTRIHMLYPWIASNWNKENQRHRVIKLFEIITNILKIPNQNPLFEIQCLAAPSSGEIIVKTSNNPDGIPFDLLSTGLNDLFSTIGHMLSRFYDAYSDSEDPLKESAVIFIDEMESFLHPEIQANLMHVLLDTFPKAQFVVTAHSPVVLASLPNEGAKAYQIEDGHAIEIEHFYGRTVQDLLYENFGLAPRFVSEVKDDLDRLTSLLQQSPIPEEANTLYDKMLRPGSVGENDSVMMYARRKLNR